MKRTLHALFHLPTALAVMAVGLLLCAFPAAFAEPVPHWPAGGADLGDLVSLAFGGIIINQANLQDMFRGFKAAFNEGFRGITPYWSQVATLVPSTTKEEKYAWLGQFPQLREWAGDRAIQNLKAHDYSIPNKKYEATIGVPKDDIEDDSFGIYSPLFAEMGHAAATHPDELIFGLLAAGFATPCYDGQFFFDTDHPVGDPADGGVASVSNMQAGAGAPWYLLDTRRMLKPLIFQRRRDYDLKAMTDMHDEHVWKRDEFQYGIDARVNVGFGFWQLAFGSKAALDDTNFNAAYAAMMAFQSDQGRPLGVKPNLLVCGPTNRAAALDTVKSERRANGATNTNRDAVDVLVVEWLA